MRSRLPFVGALDMDRGDGGNRTSVRGNHMVDIIQVDRDPEKKKKLSQHKERKRMKVKTKRQVLTQQFSELLGASDGVMVERSKGRLAELGRPWTCHGELFQSAP